MRERQKFEWGKQRKRISTLVAMCSILLLAMFFTPAQALALQPAYGSGIVVDGDPGEWDLTNDFFADMYVAGNSNNPVLSKLYLRYDCSTNLLYALVLDVIGDGLTPDQEPDEAWIKVYNIGWPNNLLIDGEGGGNTLPRGFEWVYETPGDDTTPLLGFEAYAQLSEGTYTEFEVHLNICGETSSTGKESQGNAIPLIIECDLLEMNLPQQFTLAQNYPNPFNPTTIINFGLVEPGNVNLRVYDVAGHEVVTLVDGYVSAGYHSVEFDAAGLSTGLYYYTLQMAGEQFTRKMMLVK